MAPQLGAGLLSISCESEISLVATSNEFEPEHYRLLQVIDKLEYFQCTICRAYYPKSLAVKVNVEGEINVAENRE